MSRLMAVGWQLMAKQPLPGSPGISGLDRPSAISQQPAAVGKPPLRAAAAIRVGRVATVAAALILLAACGDRDQPSMLSPGTVAVDAERELRTHGFQRLPTPPGSEGSCWLAPDRALIVLAYRRDDAVLVVERIERGVPGIGYLGRSRWEEHGLVEVGRLDTTAYGPGN